MLRLLVILGLIVLLYFLVRRALLEFSGGVARGRELPDKDQMVQDPVCRVYVPRGTAVEETVGGQTYYFCSKSCALTFQKQLAGQPQSE